jgi:hypothetical protein
MAAGGEKKTALSRVGEDNVEAAGEEDADWCYEITVE